MDRRTTVKPAMRRNQTVNLDYVVYVGGRDKEGVSTCRITSSLI
jgi:hypothetical protein